MPADALRIGRWGLSACGRIMPWSTACWMRAWACAPSPGIWVGAAAPSSGSPARPAGRTPSPAAAPDPAASTSTAPTCNDVSTRSGAPSPSRNCVRNSPPRVGRCPTAASATGHAAVCSGPTTLPRLRRRRPSGRSPAGPRLRRHAHPAERRPAARLDRGRRRGEPARPDRLRPRPHQRPQRRQGSYTDGPDSNYSARSTCFSDRR